MEINIKEGWFGDKKVSRTYAVESDIKGDVAWVVEERKFGRDTKITFPNSSVTNKYLQKEISGLKFDAPKISTKKIPIVSLEHSSYKGQDMKWTEEKTGEYITSETEIHYHYSSTNIKKFGEKQIAMVYQSRPYTEIGYAIEMPAGIKIEQYGTFETRVFLKKDSGIKIFKLKKGWSNYLEDHWLNDYI